MDEEDFFEDENYIMWQEEALMLRELIEMDEENTNEPESHLTRCPPRMRSGQVEAGSEKSGILPRPPVSHAPPRVKWLSVLLERREVYQAPR